MLQGRASPSPGCNRVNGCTGEDAPRRCSALRLLEPQSTSSLRRGVRGAKGGAGGAVGRRGWLKAVGALRQRVLCRRPPRDE